MNQGISLVEFNEAVKDVRVPDDEIIERYNLIRKKDKQAYIVSARACAIIEDTRGYILSRPALLST